MFNMKMMRGTLVPTLAGGCMTVERAKWAMIAFLFFIDVVVFYVGYQMGENHAHQEVVQIECEDANR
jgi:hypothetical protein